MFNERIIYTIILSIVIIILFNQFSKNHTYIVDKDYVFINKVHNKKKYGIIVYGDSRIYRGISPKILSNYFNGTDIINYGFSSGSFSNRMITEIINRSNHKEKILIFGITPHSFTPNAIKDEDFLQYKNLKREEIERTIYFYPLSRYIQSYNIYKILENKNVIYHQEYNTDGWVASWKEPEDTNEAISSYLKVFNNNKVSPKIINDFISNINKLSHDGYRIFAFRPPTSVAIRNIEDSTSGFNEELFVKQFETAGGIWINIPDYTKYKTYDGSHLKKEYAIKLSHFIGNKIKSYLKNNYSTR